MASRRSGVSCTIPAVALSSRASPAEGPGAAGPACACPACLPSCPPASRHSAQPLPNAASPDGCLSPLPEGPHLHRWPCRFCAAPLDVSPQGGPAVAVLAHHLVLASPQRSFAQPRHVLPLMQDVTQHTVIQIVTMLHIYW